MPPQASIPACSGWLGSAGLLGSRGSSLWKRIVCVCLFGKRMRRREEMWQICVSLFFPPEFPSYDSSSLSKWWTLPINMHISVFSTHLPVVQCRFFFSFKIKWLGISSHYHACLHSMWKTFGSGNTWRGTSHSCRAGGGWSWALT